MTEAIDVMSNYLRAQGIAGVLCFRTAREIYAARSFQVARHGSDIIIKLHVPYTLYDVRAISVSDAGAGGPRLGNRVEKLATISDSEFRIKVDWKGKRTPGTRSCT